MSAFSSQFYSSMMDGSTDAGNTEQELVLISFCRKDNSARKVRSCTKLLSLLSPKSRCRWPFKMSFKSITTNVLLFKDIEEILLYLYNNPPKKCRDLIAGIDDLKEVFELPKGGNLPIHSQGSRWINHKRKVLLIVTDQYREYVCHLSTLTEDTPLKSEERACIKGYLAKWKQYRTILGCGFYADILKLSAILFCVYKIVN